MRAYMQGITKEQFVAETKRHARLDHFLRGNYSRGVKGCAVGCAIKSINKIKGVEEEYSAHKALETHLGIPEWLAMLEDELFENISYDRHKSWPVEFSEAINTGADLNEIKIPFLIYVLNFNIETQKSNLEECKDNNVSKIIKGAIEANKQMIIALESGNKESIEKAESAAESAARSAAWSAARSAESAAWSAAWSAAESAARSAARSARSAESAARSARSAAWLAAESPAESEAYDKFADELLRLMKECE